MTSIITSYEYYDYRAPNSANLNDDNGDFSITIHNEDLITHPHSSLLELRGKITGTMPGIPAVGDQDEVPPTQMASLDLAKITLAPGGWLHLFDRIDYYIGENKIDTVRKPGITCLMKGLASFENDRKYCDAGWNYSLKEPENTMKTSGWFTVTIPLRIVMGFFEDHKSYVYHMIQKLVFYRTAKGFNNMFRLAPAYLGATFDLDLKDVILKMPHVKFDLDHATKVRSEITTGSKYDLYFRKWSYNYIIPPQGTDFTWDIPVTYSKVKYLLIVFQTNRVDNRAEDGGQFDLCDLENCQVVLNNNVYYPHERMNMRVTEHRCAPLYTMFKRFKSSYYTLVEDLADPLLSYTEFLTKNPMIVIDCSNQPDILKTELINMKIFFNWRSPLPANTVVHCVTIVDDKAVYQPRDNIVTHT